MSGKIQIPVGIFSHIQTVHPALDNDEITSNHLLFFPIYPYKVDLPEAVYNIDQYVLHHKIRNYLAI
jgi:hypothetical protein